MDGSMSEACGFPDEEVDREPGVIATSTEGDEGGLYRKPFAPTDECSAMIFMIASEARGQELLYPQFVRLVHLYDLTAR
ncbi:hypothetical protein VPNG_00102 [Cytospora leucostoma]|uniref:Uncharacterized protein n=1 Tax=Cytospora leucostoma TaxID=1230097 RepID=A0A423XPF4_9PEZI|nr:hypothetical protein VPNG_00102 [Cytospora leucostoma]